MEQRLSSQPPKSKHHHSFSTACAQSHTLHCAPSNGVSVSPILERPSHTSNANTSGYDMSIPTGHQCHGNNTLHRSGHFQNKAICGAKKNIAERLFKIHDDKHCSSNYLSSSMTFEDPKYRDICAKRASQTLNKLSTPLN